MVSEGSGLAAAVRFERSDCLSVRPFKSAQLSPDRLQLMNRESLIESLESAKLELNLARMQCSNEATLTVRVHRSIVQAARALVGAVDIGFNEVWPTGWWMLWALRDPDDATRPPCKVQIGETVFAATTIRVGGSGLNPDGTIADDTLVALWRFDMGITLRSTMPTSKGSAGKFDFPEVKQDADGFVLDRNSKRIAESGEKAATVHDSYSAEQSVEHLRNQVADWVDQCSAAITILRTAKMRPKMRGECKAPDAQTWAELTQEAKHRVEQMSVNYQFRNALMATAEAWADLILTDLDEPKQFGEWTYSVYGRRINLFTQWVYRTSKIWNESADALFKQFKESIVFEAWEYFNDARQLIESVECELSLMGDAYFTKPIATEFHRLLIREAAENGLDCKPKFAKDYVRLISTELAKVEEPKAVVVHTVGDLWKAFAENKTPGIGCLAISLDPQQGPNIAIPTFPNATDQLKWDALERAIALCDAEGGSRENAMRTLIAKVALERGVARSEVVNMPIVEFSANQKLATKSSGDSNRKGGRPKGANLSKVELECIAMHQNGKRPGDIDEVFMKRKNAKRGTGEEWTWGTAQKVIDAAKARNEIPRKRRKQDS